MRTKTILSATILGGLALIATRDKNAATRQRIVDKALAYVGSGLGGRHFWERLGHEELGDNPWCGGFALNALHEAGVAVEVPWVIGKGFLYRLPRTTDPKPGDIAYYTHLQHHAVVMSREGSLVKTVDGNQPDIRVRERPYSAAAAYYSIEPWLKT